MLAAVGASGKTNLLLETPDVPGWKTLLAHPAVPCEGSLIALPDSLTVPGLFGLRDFSCCYMLQQCLHC